MSITGGEIILWEISMDANCIKYSYPLLEYFMKKLTI